MALDVFCPTSSRTLLCCTLFCILKNDDEGKTKRKTATICRNTKRSREERNTKTANVDIKMCVECTCKCTNIHIIIGSRSRLPQKKTERERKHSTFVSLLRGSGCWFATAVVVSVCVFRVTKMNMQYPLMKIEIDSEQIFFLSFVPFPFLHVLISRLIASHSLTTRRRRLAAAGAL